MRFAIFVGCLALVAPVVGAQTASHGWRFGADIGAPSRLLSDGSSHLSLGIGAGLNAERIVAGSGAAHALVLARVYLAPVNGTGSSNDWSPGHAFIADLSLRAEHTGDKVDLFAGGGLSHWSGPGSVSPFAGASSVLLTAEAGGSMRGWRQLRYSVTAQATRFGPDDDRGVLSGTVLRFLLGVQRDY